MASMLLLDASIRNYVLVPIFLIVCFMSIIRGNFLGPSKMNNKVKPEDARNTHHITRSKMLMGNSRWLSTAAYSSRVAFYNKKVEGFFHKAPKDDAEQDPMAALAQNQDMSSMTGQMFSQFMNMGLSMGFGWLVSEIFSGMVVARTPFPLTFKFKFMLQSGINLPNLDVNFISSMSFYMFCLLASGALLQLVYAFFASEANVLDNQALMQAQMGMPAAPGGMPGMPGQPSTQKRFEQAMAALEHNQPRPEAGWRKAPQELLAAWRSEFC